MSDNLFVVTDVPIKPENVSAKVESRDAGAVTIFCGTVREWTKGRKTLYLEYQAYESMAVKKLAEIGEQVQEKWPAAKVAITHRVGRLEISDLAVVIAVSSPHRKAAYEANEFVIEQIKKIVPIWKKEHWEDGELWIGDQLQKVEYSNGKPMKGSLADD